jgi:mRNA interferase MazF
MRVVATPRQGEVWWAEAEDKRRPVLIVTRSEAIPVLTSIVVAPVTRTIRGIATEILLGTGDGLPSPCVASFDNIQPVHRSLLTTRVGAAPPERRSEICGALEALADC